MLLRSAGLDPFMEVMAQNSDRVFCFKEGPESSLRLLASSSPLGSGIKAQYRRYLDTASIGDYLLQVNEYENFDMDVGDFIEEIAAFDSLAPEAFLWVDNDEDWPYLEIRIKGGCLIREVGKYLEDICKPLIPNIIFCGDCTKGYHLRARDPLSPKEYFAVKIQFVEGDVGPVGWTFRLESENPKKDLTRDYRDGLVREFEQKGLRVYKSKSQEI